LVHTYQGLAESTEVISLGLKFWGYRFWAIKPTPETARALEQRRAKQLQRESDEAIYARRNAAVEQERAIPKTN